MVIDELAQLDELSFSGDMKGAKQSGNMTLKFKDKKTNGLKQLIDTGQRVYESFSNLGIGIDFQKDELESLKLAK